MQFFKFAFALISSAVLISAAPAANGDATWYEPGLGACGGNNNRGEFVAALNSADYANGRNCGRRIRLNYQGRSVDVTAVDLCPGCHPGGIDLSPAAFQQLAPLDAGRIQVNWDFI